MRMLMVLFGLIAVVSGFSGCSEDSSKKNKNDAGERGSDDLSKDSDSESDDLGKDSDSESDDLSKDSDSESDDLGKDSDSESDDLGKDSDSESDDLGKDSDSESDDLGKDSDSGSDDPGKDSDSESDDSEVTVNESNVCPHVILGSSVPVTYKGNTGGLPNWVESNRLEWGDASVDSLLFVAPEDGEYIIKVTGNSEMDGIWPSIQDYRTNRYYTEADCPAQGTTASIDGVFSSGNPEYPETFTAGQHVLIWISASTWEPIQSGPYTITVEKLAR